MMNYPCYMNEKARHFCNYEDLSILNPVKDDKTRVKE